MANLADLIVRVKSDVTAVDFDKVPKAADDAVADTESTFDRLKNNLPQIATAAGAAAGAALMIGVGQAIEGDAVGDRIGAQLGLAGPQAEQAGQTTGELWAEGLGAGTGEVGQTVAMVQAQLDGLDSGGVKTISRDVQRMADVLGLDAAQSIQTVDSLVTNGLAPNYDAAVDLMVAGAQRVGPGLADPLAEAAKEYDAHFASMGLGGEQMFAILSSASDEMDLDKAGDAIKELGIRAIDGSDTTADAFATIGLDADTMATDIASGGDKARDAFDQIVAGLRDVEDPAERSRAAVALFGTPVEDLSSAALPQFLDMLGQSSAAMKVTGDESDSLAGAADNAAGKIERIKRSGQQWLANLVEMDGPLGTTAAGIAAFGPAIAPVIPAIVTLATTYGGSIATMAAAAATGTASAVASGARWVAATVVQGATAAASMVKTAALFVGKYALMGAKSLIAAGKVAASWVIAMGPVGWVIAAVVALVALIVANWDTVKKWTKAVWTWVSNKVASAWRWMKDATSSAVDAVKGWFTDMRDRAKTLVASLYDNTVGRFNRLKARAIAIVTGLVLAAVRKVTELRTNAVAKVEELKARAVTVFTDAKNKVVSTVGDMKRRVVEFFGDLKQGAVDKANALLDFIRSIPGKVTSALGDLGSLLLDAGKDIVNGLIRGITSKLGALKDKAGELAGAVRGFFPFSPAKEGPLSGRGSPDVAGSKIATMLAAGMGSELSTLTAMADRAARAAMPNVDRLEVPRAAGPPSAQVRAGSLVGDPATPGRAGATFHQSVTLQSTRDVATDAQQAALTLRTLR